MPSTKQIIPAYDVPHIMTVINDNSTINPITSATATEPATRFLCIFDSAMGPDGVHTVSSTTDFLKMYGTPDFKKYGQACYMPYIALSSGNAVCHCLRVTAPNATYAHVVLLANVTTVEDGVSVKFTTTTFTSPGLLDRANIASLTEALTDEDSAIKVYPIATFSCIGRGKYGNEISIRIVSNAARESMSEYRYYTFEVYSSIDGLSRDEFFVGSTYFRAVNSAKSEFVSDIIGDPDKGSKIIEMYVSEESISAVYNAYATAVGSGAVPETDFDLFYGLARNSTTSTISGYTIDATSVSLDAVTGIPLTSGSDGNLSFDESEIVDGQRYTVNGVTISGRAACVIHEYLKAMSTLSDEAFLTEYTDETTRRYGRELLSKYRNPTDVMLDAAYPDNVKYELYKMAMYRGDTMLYLDGGVGKETIGPVLTWNTTFSQTNNVYRFDTPNLERYIQWMKVRDPFNGKIIPVSYTWYIASALPAHIYNNGNHIPFVGNRFAALTGYVKNSIRPNIDADDLETKNVLYKARINTIDTISENSYILATQITAQTRISDLSKANNTFVLLEMKRTLENLVAAKLYDFAEDEDRVRFTEDATRLFDDFVNRKLFSFEVRFEMNEFERERDLLHCYLEVVFRQISTGGIIEIDINPRT